MASSSSPLFKSLSSGGPLRLPSEMARGLASVVAVVACLGGGGTAHSACVVPLGDVDGSGVASVPDVQCEILSVLAGFNGSGTPVCAQSGAPGSSDTNCDDAATIADVQLVISYVLGVSLNPLIDADGSGCPDACEVIPCVPPPPGVKGELCDGFDNDCDGLVDEDWPYLGETCTAGSGPCANAGVLVCDSVGLGAVCSATPSAPTTSKDKTCDGVDDDCDGATDDDVNVKPTTCGLGACAGSTGFQLCQNGAMVNTCNPTALAAAHDKVCNGIDDDCDGATDEDYVAKATSCGVGACKQVGSLQCAAGALVDTCAPLAPLSTTDKTCDGIDDNCNGQTDEGWAVPPKVYCGTGACKQPMVGTCTAGVESTSCEPLAPPTTTDVTCDGIDDNCNGQTDEQCPIPPGCNLGYDTDCEIPTPAKPSKSCKTPDATYCAYFAANIDDYDDFYDAVNAPFTLNPLQGGSSALECYIWSAISCLPCGYPTLSHCDNPPPFSTSPCSDVATAFCPMLNSLLCPDPTLTQCAITAYYNNGPFLTFYDASCTPYVQQKCDLAFETWCEDPSTLADCVPILADPMAIEPSACRTHVYKDCVSIIQLQCPAGDVATCAAIEAGTASIHPACTALMTERCDNYLENFCPVHTGVSLSSESCVTDYPQLTGAAVPQPCRDWVDSNCPALIADAAQASFAAHTDEDAGCDNVTIVEGSGYAYSVVDSVSDKGEFDCTPPEASPIHPHDQVFELNIWEILLVSIPIAVLNQELGGEAIHSCDEYVKQKYYDYFLHKEFVKLFESDPRRAWQAVYAENYPDHAMGTKVFQSEGTSSKPFGQYPDGFPYLDVNQTLNSVGGNTHDLKNDYARINEPKYQKLRDRLYNYADRAGVFEPPFLIALKQQQLDAMKPKVQAAFAYWYKSQTYDSLSGWHWHYDMSQRLRDQGITDEELFTQYSRRQQFLALLDEWYSQEKGISSLQFKIDHYLINGVTAYQQIEQMRAIQNEIVEEVDDLLSEANSLGCFNHVLNAQGKKMPAVCDWAPVDTLQAIDNEFFGDIEAARSRCEKILPGDLSSVENGYGYIYNSGGDLIYAYMSASPFLNLSLFELYLTRMEDTDKYDTLYFQQIPPSQRPIYGQSYGDSGEVGDKDYFAITYGYGAGWSLDVPPVEINLCQLEAAGHAYLDSDLWVLNSPFSIIDAGLQADTATATFETHLSVLGIDFWQEGGVGAGPEIPNLHYDLNLAFDGGTIEESDSNSFSTPIFSLGGISIVLEAGYTGRLGIESNGYLQFGANFDGQTCDTGLDLGLGFRVRPYGSLDGFIQAGLDLWIVEIGVGGSLNIIDVSVPVDLSLNAEAAANFQVTTANLSVDVNAELVISTLAGRLYFYVDTFWKTYKETFFRWQGKEWTFDLFSKTFDFNLGLTFNYCLSFDCFE